MSQSFSNNQEMTNAIIAELKRRGRVRFHENSGEYEAHCPFHDDQKPSFNFNPEKGTYHCHARGCKASGTARQLAKALGITPSPSPIKRLTKAQAISKLKRERCLTDNTLSHFNITANMKKKAWQYPVRGGTRFKAFNSRAGRKYWHTKGTPSQLYGLADIPDGTSEIWLVNGEVSVWQLWQAGVSAVSGIFGEGNLPDDAAEQLKAKGVKKINVCLDTDKSGREGAREVWEKLKDDFEILVRLLPESLGEGSDIGDLFVSLGGDPQKFVETIYSLPLADTEEWEKSSLKATIERIRLSSDLRAYQQKQLISKVIASDLKKKGFFVVDDNGYYYWFHDKEKRLLLFSDSQSPSAHDPRFLSIIEDNYQINASETEFKHLVESLRTEAELRGKRSHVYRFARYQDGKLYVSRFNGQVYRLDGEKIDLIPNGEDGVLFYDDRDWTPYQYLGDQEGRYLYPLLVDPVSFSTDAQLTQGEQKMLYLLWLYSLFFESLAVTKPILLFLGEKGSGKTSTLRWIIKWLFGPNCDVHSLVKQKEDGFIATVTSSYLAVFDNVDARVPWLNDHLATLATSGEMTLRKLYTTNEKVTYHPRVFLALTARTPQFKRDDVVDRLLLLRVNRLESFKSEKKLLEERLEARDRLWTEMLNDLNQIVKALQEDNETLTSAYRLADWAELAWKIAKTQGLGQDFLDTADKLETEKSSFLLEDDPFYLCLDMWLAENEGREVDIQTLFNELKQIAEDNSITWTYESTRSLAQRITRIKDNLKDFLEVEVKSSRVGKGKSLKNVYRFRRKTG